MRKLLSVAVATFAAVLLVTNTSGAVFAQSSGLGIRPRDDLVIAAGKSTTEQLSVTNLDKTKQLNLSLQVIDFGARDETGTPALELDEDVPQTPWSLRPFLTAPKTLSIAPGKTENIKYTVAIPANQGAGSYYSAIRYVAQGEDGGNVAISASGATLVFVTVPGQAKESLTLKQFGAYEAKSLTKGDYKSAFVSSQPQRLAFTVQNHGNVAERPAGSILVKNMFGKQVAVVKDINPKASLALIEQTRRFEMCIVDSVTGTDSSAQTSEAAAEGDDCKSPGLMPGRYTATLNAFYGINGSATREIVTTASFWYLPVWFLVILAVLILAIAVGIYMLYRRFNGGRSFSRRK